MTRAAWRIYWRANRIIARETARSLGDAMIFGAGFMRWGDFGDWRRDGSDVVRFVPASEVFL